MDDNTRAVLIGYLLIICAIAIGFWLFFLPTQIAFGKKHAYKWIILLLNIFFGATIVGWVLLMVWAIFPKDKSLISPVVSPSGNLTAGQQIAGIVKEVNGSDMLSELKKLADLKNCGAINDHEFQYMKAALFAKHNKNKF